MGRLTLFESKHYIIKLKIKNGLMAAIMNSTTPIIVVCCSSSIIPEIISKAPRNPRMGGIICENISVPVAILSHYSLF